MFKKTKYKLFLKKIAIALLNAENINKHYEYILKNIIETPSKYLLNLTLFRLNIYNFPEIELIENTKNLENLQNMKESHFNLPHFLLNTFYNYKELKFFKLFLLILIKAQYTTFLFKPYYQSHRVDSGHELVISEDNLINYIIKIISYDDSLKTIINKNLNKIIEYNIKSLSRSSSLSSSSYDNFFFKIDYFIKIKKIKNNKKDYDTLQDVLENFLDFDKTKKLNKLYRLKYFKNALEIDLEHQPYINPLIKYSKEQKEYIKIFMKESYPNINIFYNAKKMNKYKNKHIDSKLLSSIIDKIIES
tara:strand:- start:358 stop:1269 length:912 start_codon:yes stop_codon:yes gene_type:complete